MLASGDNLPTVMHGGIAFSNLLIAEVARHVAPEHYTETVNWLSKFLAHYHVSVLRKGISIGLTPSVRSLQPTST